jgi:hypothetical protein
LANYYDKNVDNIKKVIYFDPVKAKPAARQGRKATDLLKIEIAGLPAREPGIFYGAAARSCRTQLSLWRKTFAMFGNLWDFVGAPA